MCGGLAQQINQMLIINNHFGTYFPIPPIDFYEQIKMAQEFGKDALADFNRITIGASAGVFGIMLAYTTLFPYQRLGLWIKNDHLSKTTDKYLHSWRDLYASVQSPT